MKNLIIKNNQKKKQNKKKKQVNNWKEVDAMGSLDKEGISKLESKIKELETQVEKEKSDNQKKLESEID